MVHVIEQKKAHIAVGLLYSGSPWGNEITQTGERHCPVECREGGEGLMVWCAFCDVHRTEMLRTGKVDNRVWGSSFRWYRTRRILRMRLGWRWSVMRMVTLALWWSGRGKTSEGDRQPL